MMENQQIPPLPQPVIEHHPIKIIILLITIASILIVGLGILLPNIISIVNTATKRSQDKVRQELSNDYISPDAAIVNMAPTLSDLQSQTKVNFDIKKYPLFQQYGYDESFMFQGQNSYAVRGVPNASSSLFAAETAGIIWNTEDTKLDSDPSKGFPVSSIMVFNNDTSYLKLMPLPKLSSPCCDASVAWLGNRYLLVNEFVQAAGAGNYFYIGDTASSTINRTFVPIPIPQDLQNTKQYLGLGLSSHPHKNLAVLSYCLTTVNAVDSDYCSQFGFSIATPQRIVEIMTKNTQDTFKTGWDEDNLYIQETSKDTGVSMIYKFPIDQYENDQFINTIALHPDPTVKGTPAWLQLQVPIATTTDALTFDVNLASTSTDSRGMLTVTLNNKLVGNVYEEQETPGVHTKTLYFSPPPFGTSTLEFRLDPLNPVVQSSIYIANVKFGYLPFGNQ